MKTSDYIVSRVNGTEIEVLAVDSAFALCENVVAELMSDEDDLICITKYSDANADLQKAADAFRFSIQRTQKVSRTGGDHRSLSPSTETFAGVINGREFEVEINELAAPRFSVTLSDDEKSQIIEAIEAGC